MQSVLVYHFACNSNRALHLVYRVPAQCKDTKRECHSCKQDFCMRCGVTWHAGLACAAYQALPAEERSSTADLQVCYAVQRYAVLCNSMPCRNCCSICFLKDKHVAMPCCAILCHAVQCSATLCRDLACTVSQLCHAVVLIQLAPTPALALLMLCLQNKVVALLICRTDNSEQCCTQLSMLSNALPC